MPYGVHAGRKQPGEYSIADLLGFGLAGALGIIAAIMTDMTQSNDASALFTISKWFSFLTDMVGIGELPLYAVILVLMSLGAASVYYFQPVTLQGAFVQGFGVLAAVMTIAPADLGAPLDAPEEMGTIIEEVEARNGSPEARLAGYIGSAEGMAVRGIFINDAMHAGIGAPRAAARVTSLQRAEVSVRYNLSIEVMLPDGLRNDVETMIRRGQLRGKIHNETTGKTYNIFRNSGAMIRTAQGGKTLVIDTSIEGNADRAKLFARIEAAGYAITVEEFTASASTNNTWRIAMTPSNTPLVIQRLSQSYWF